MANLLCIEQICITATKRTVFPNLKRSKYEPSPQCIFLPIQKPKISQHSKLSWAAPLQYWRCYVRLHWCTPHVSLVRLKVRRQSFGRNSIFRINKSLVLLYYFYPECGSVAGDGNTTPQCQVACQTARDPCNLRLSACPHVNPSVAPTNPPASLLHFISL